MGDIGAAKKQAGDLDGAAAAFVRARQLGGVSQSSFEALTRELMHVASLKMKRGCVAEALQDILEVLHIFESAGAPQRPGMARLLAGIGDLQTRLGDLAGAAASYAKAQELHKRFGLLDTPSGARLLSCLGNVKRMCLDSQGALEAYVLAKQIWERLGE